MKKKIIIITAGIVGILAVLLILFAVFIGNAEINESKIYKPILDKYEELLIYKDGDGDFSELKHSFKDKIDKEIFQALVSITEDCSPYKMGYATKDINGDGVKELALMNTDREICALFTIVNRKPLLVEDVDKNLRVDSEGTVGTYKFDKESATWLAEISTLNSKGKLDTYVEFGSGSEVKTYFKKINGERSDITMDEANELIYQYNLGDSRRGLTNKKAGFRFIYVLENENTKPKEDLLPVDFSSYDSTLETFKSIVNFYKDYTSEKWVGGLFDAKFSFDNDEEFDIFNRLFYYGAQCRPTSSYFGSTYAEGGNNAYGYAKKDLNGDDIEDLVLLNDNYDIIAIFTMKNGNTVMLNDAYGSWIDENGLLHTEKSTGGVVSRDGEAFLYEIKDGALKCIFGVGYKVNFYLQKEGWYKIEGDSQISISQEEGEALYARYDILPDGYMQNEYTRTFSGLEFIPLFKGTLASQKYINKYSNSYFRNGDTITISEVYEKSVMFTFECVQTVGDYDVSNPENTPEVYRTTVTGEAMYNDGKYVFEQDGIKGYIKFSVDAVWVIVTESKNEHVYCRAYLFNYAEENNY